jgi:hypothetical protein
MTHNNKTMQTIINNNKLLNVRFFTLFFSDATTSKGIWPQSAKLNEKKGKKIAQSPSNNPFLSFLAVEALKRV